MGLTHPVWKFPHFFWTLPSTFSWIKYLKSKNIIERANLVENIIKRLFFLIRLHSDIKKLSISRHWIYVSTWSRGCLVAISSHGAHCGDGMLLRLRAVRSHRLETIQNGELDLGQQDVPCLFLYWRYLWIIWNLFPLQALPRKVSELNIHTWWKSKWRSQCGF